MHSPDSFDFKEMRKHFREFSRVGPERHMLETLKSVNKFCRFRADIFDF